MAHTVVLVTGGASGLGRACVEHFAGKGARVVLFDLKIEGFPAGQEKFANVEAFAGDVRLQGELID